MHIPPRVAAIDPDKPVPPEQGVTGMSLLWHTLKMALAWSVVLG